jgi:hypothetical protein
MQQPDLKQLPEVRELETTVNDLATYARDFKVTTAEQYSAAGADLTRIKAARKRLDDIRTGITRPMDAAKKAVMDFFRAPGEKLDQAERAIKRAMVDFTEEQERLRLEEQRRADEAARKERDRLAAQAARAAESGKIEKAEQLQARAATVVAPVISREPPKVTGVSTRDVWKFEIVNEMEVPREYLMVDESKIRKVVGALKGETRIAGVRVWPEKSIAAGAA